jgi:hypothetical protein
MLVGQMDELELRIASLELLVTELMPWLDPQALADAKRSIESGLSTVLDGDELAIRAQALDLIELAQKRFAPPLNGLVIAPQD